MLIYYIVDISLSVALLFCILQVTTNLQSSVSNFVLDSLGAKETRVSIIWSSVGALDSNSLMKVSQQFVSKSVTEILRKRDGPVIWQRLLHSSVRVYNR